MAKHAMAQRAMARRYVRSVDSCDAMARSEPHLYELNPAVWHTTDYRSWHIELFSPHTNEPLFSEPIRLHAPHGYAQYYVSSKSYITFAVDANDALSITWGDETYSLDPGRSHTVNLPAVARITAEFN